MTVLARRVMAVAVPTGGGRGDTASGPEVGRPDTSASASASSTPVGLFRVLLAVPAAYVAAVRGLRADPPWASRRYVPDPAALRAHDTKVAERLLARHGRDRLLDLFPGHAELLGIQRPAETTVVVTVVEPPALTAAPHATPEFAWADLVEVAR